MTDPLQPHGEGGRRDPDLCGDLSDRLVSGVAPLKQHPLSDVELFEAVLEGRLPVITVGSLAPNLFGCDCIERFSLRRSRAVRDDRR